MILGGTIGEHLKIALEKYSNGMAIAVLLFDVGHITEDTVKI